jgi:(1->4)-alpha-D-glucan 1-alpha-D-glucosylmutase
MHNYLGKGTPVYTHTTVSQKFILLLELCNVTTTAMSPDLQALLSALVQEIEQHKRVPIATYRLQLHAGFTFTQAQHLIPYLHALGISDCYTSPYLQARPGSPHGYDVTNPQALNAEIGTQADYTAFTQTLQHYGMGHVLDIVPNHMGIIGGDNPWWRDVLEHGPASTYARFFDINWQPPKTALHNKILLPILGAPYGTVLENQELRLHYAAGAFELHYYEHRLPIAPCTLPDILHACLADLQQRLGSLHPQTLELFSIMTALAHLPQRTEQAPAQIAERYRETAVAKRRLAALYETCMELQTALRHTIHTYNGTPGQPASFDRLHALLEAQSYRLSDWRTATDELNYRRFFDIVHLAGVRVEDPVVFEATHHLIGQLLAERKVTGLRIDHPDGLLDPARYFRQLQQAYVLQHSRRLLAARAEITDGSERSAVELAARFMAEYASQSDAAAARPLYLVVEKILETHERLPEDWSVHGTTGYDFLNQLNGLFVDSRHATAFAALYADFIGERSTCAETLYTTKKLILHTSLASELDALGCLLERVAEADRCWRDCTRRQLVQALGEVIVCFPVYRTYINDETVHVRPADRAVIEMAIATAQQRHPGIHARVFALLHDVLTLCYPQRSDESVRQVQRLFVQRFQQLTGPAMAKGLEDTAFYRYTPLASLNEVGGNPDQFGVSVSAFHQYNVTRQQHWPGTLLATSTHDTKRSEDVRARLNVLSEIPQQWRDCLWRWQHLNQQHKTTVAGQHAPSRQDEYLLYQTLLGA